MTTKLTMEDKVCWAVNREEDALGGKQTTMTQIDSMAKR
jgi:hypothetical protein